MKKFFSIRNRFIFTSIPAIFLFLGVGHHLFNFWEQPAWKMVALFIVGAPFFIWGLTLFTQWIKPLIQATDKKRIILLISSAIFMGILLGWKYYRAPTAYQILEIAPTVLDNENIELLEVKANNRVIKIRESEILAAGWQKDGDVIVATKKSQPLLISFKATINTPVVILMNPLPETGEVEASLGGNSVTASHSAGQTKLTLASQYRSAPNWIFTPLLAVSSIIMFSSLILILLLIQQRGMFLTASAQKTSTNHRKNLLVLLAAALTIHLFNVLTTPLILDVDTPSYLSGAVHWLKFGNLNGTHAARGIGSTFLFTPILLLFGRNPWGMKIFLHLFAIACVPLAYKIGWQLTKSGKVAFFSGFFAMVSPDLLLYSNYLWSDLINLFAVLVYSTALLSALQKPTFLRILASMFIGAMATLFRTENITLIGIGAFFLLWEAIKSFNISAWKKKKTLSNQRNMTLLLGKTGLSLLLALIPIFLSAAHNQNLHGFFGLSNYAGAVFYDGWIYFGDASHLNFSNQNSEAIQVINKSIERYPIIVTDKNNVPTSLETYPSLIQSGYSPQEIMELYTQAVIDSITNNWGLTFKLLEIKINDGLSPFITHLQTLPLPGESPNPGAVKNNFYDSETLSIPVLINIQRKINAILPVFYFTIYPYIVWFMVISAFFAPYRKPSNLWMAFFIIATTRIFIPIIMGASLWRFALAGLIPLQILAVAWVLILWQGIEKESAAKILTE